jgi:hypothetical protein
MQGVIVKTGPIYVSVLFDGEDEPRDTPPDSLRFAD